MTEYFFPGKDYAQSELETFYRLFSKLNKLKGNEKPDPKEVAAFLYRYEDLQHYFDIYPTDSDAHLKLAIMLASYFMKTFPHIKEEFRLPGMGGAPKQSLPSNTRELIDAEINNGNAKTQKEAVERLLSLGKLNSRRNPEGLIRGLQVEEKKRNDSLAEAKRLFEPYCEKTE